MLPGACLPRLAYPVRAALAKALPVLLCAPGNGAIAPDSVTLGAYHRGSRQKRFNMQRTLMLSTVAAASLLLAACATPGTPTGLQPGQTVAIVNSLSWDNPLSGKRDGVRTSWPIKDGKIAAEYFPLAQLKQCDAGGKAFAWGVMRAQRGTPALAYAQGGVDVALSVSIDVARRQDARQGETQTAMAIPQDVAALAGKQRVQPSWKLKYGKVEQVDLDYGVRYQVCVQRYDAAGKAIDSCDIPFI